jgi:lipoate-protein ligase A
MQIVRSFSNNPYVNLATEEYFLKNATDEFFIIWVSHPAVIVGKHQNALAEINYRYVLENDIMVARRISGGGTVVHDLQNLNFCFITNGVLDFKQALSPIINYLQSLGLDVYLGNKHEILVGDFKISGNSAHVYKNRVMHHGTLLFNSNLTRLKKAIETHPGKYFDKAVQSNRSSVTNIFDELHCKINFDEFTDGLVGYVSRQINKSRQYTIQPIDISAIEKLAIEKYCTNDWIYGYSPKYFFRSTVGLYNEMWQAELTVEKGKIQQADIFRDQLKMEQLENLLVGKYHLFDPIQEALSGLNKNVARLNGNTYNFF